MSPVDLLKTRILERLDHEERKIKDKVGAGVKTWELYRENVGALTFIKEFKTLVQREYDMTMRDEG